MSSTQLSKKKLNKLIAKAINKALKKTKNNAKKTKRKNKKPKKVAITPTAPYPTVPVSEAENATQNWFDYNFSLGDGSANNDFIQAFSIGAADIEGIYNLIQGDSNITGCRIYLGMSTVPTYPGNPVNPASVLKLYLVAVENMDLDSTPKVAGEDYIFSPHTGDSLVYDFSCPCPPTCDRTSILHHDSVWSTQEKKEQTTN